jgi:carbamoyl-phosphate synthase large subunit
VSGVGGDIGAGVVESLLGGGFDVIGADMAENPVSLSKLGGFSLLPPASDEKNYIAKALDAARAGNVGFYFPVSEQEIEVLSRHRHMFDAAGVRLVMNSVAVLDVFLDKYETWKFIRAMDPVLVPETGLVPEGVLKSGFPLILKPRKGRGSRGQFVIRDGEEFRFHAARIDAAEYVVQEMVGSADEEYTTAVFSDGRKTETISFRRRLGFGGVSSVVELVQDRAAAQLARALAERTGLVGSINVQSRKVAGTHKVFEVNPRVSSTVSFRRFFGFDDPVWWIKALDGVDFDFVPRYSAGIGKRVLGEVYFGLEPFVEGGH